MAELSGHVEGKLVCIDGKTMRRTFARERGEGPLHIVSAWVAENGVLSLKDNQPLLHQEVVGYFDDALSSGVELPYHESVDKGHGRLEVRRVWTSTDIGWMSVRQQWKGLRSLVMVERERQAGEKTSKERSYFLSSHAFDRAERAGYLVRGHWGIENGLHWVLDMVFDEDHSREPTDGKKSVARKRKRAGWDHEYLFKVLAAAAPPDSST